MIVGVTKKSETDLAGYAGQRDTLKQSMLGERQNQVFEDYVAGVQRRMNQDGDIKIYDEVLTELEQSEPAAEPIMPGGFTLPPQ